MIVSAFRDGGVQLVTNPRGLPQRRVSAIRTKDRTQTHTAMTTALKLPAETPLQQLPPAPIRLSENEVQLRSEFEAAFNDTRRPGFDLHAAVWNVTDDLRHAGQSAESLVKRVKYI